MILMRVAERGAFVAETVEREGGTWTATGRWKYPSGRFSDSAATYTWPVARVIEIRWDYEDGGPA